jgi:hypothetical protein
VAESPPNLYNPAFDQRLPPWRRHAILFQNEAAEVSEGCRSYVRVWRRDGYSSIEGMVWLAQTARARRCYEAARALVKCGELL